MNELDNLQVELQQYNEIPFNSEYDLDRIIFDLDSDIDLLSSQGDKLDYLVSIGSGLMCGVLDILWVGDFSLERGRNIASDEVDKFVTKTAKLLGCKKDGLKGAVEFLEENYHLPSDGNTPDFGGGLQHHLRDFAHHPTIAGLMFSLLTQFTEKSYGTDVNGIFKIVNVPIASKAFIGDDVPSKILFGTITWFFHLVSDMAGSSSSAGKSGGTGIPGPMLALAKELSVLPVFNEINVGDNSLSVFLSKLFNGTLLAKHDEFGKIIKDTQLRFDLRAELGVGLEIGRQAVPVVANECIVRTFYFIRRLALEIQENDIQSIAELKQIDWDKVKPMNSPTISRMLLIATGVFTTLDVGEAIVSQKYWVAINYVGVGRFAVAIGEDVTWGLKARNVKKIKQMYEGIKRNAFMEEDDNLYRRIGEDMNIDKFGLNLEQTEILYNLEYYKTLSDIMSTKLPINNEAIKSLKHDWLREWKEYISKGFSSFLQVDEAEIHWYTEQELIQKIEENDPHNTWFRLVLLEAMLFEPYYPLGLEMDKKGNSIPSKKYKALQNMINGYKKNNGDDYLDSLFSGSYYTQGYIKRLRKAYDKILRELSEVHKALLATLSVTAVIAIITIATAGIFGSVIAVALVGSNFAGLSGAALTAACLAYLGGGAIAVGGMGMAGGMMTIVGGATVLGLGVGAGVGGTMGAVRLIGKQNTILQSAKLLVSVREIFLNDEHDTAYSNTVYEQYLHNIMDIEKGLVELRLQADVAQDDDKKRLKNEIKNAEESVEAMKIARVNLNKFISSFEVGLDQE